MKIISPSILHNLYRSFANATRQDMAKTTVFVYGTLKSGEPNHDWITTKSNGYAKFIGKAQTATKYPLVIASQYNIPFLLHHPGVGKNVIGEVYEVDESMLSKLDILEQHPEFYVREIDQVEMLSGAEGKASNTTNCWIYFLKTFRESLMNEEFYSEYRSAGSHGKPYVPSADTSRLEDML